MSPFEALRKSLAEFFGTFAMVFAGTGAIVINAESGGAITHLGGLFPFASVLLYLAAQFSGALLASLTLCFLFPQNANLGATIPAGLPMQSFALEIILSAMLMFVILNVSHGSKEKGITAGIVVGSVIALEALFAGPICGASMNPARSLGPAIVSGHLEHLWIYLAAPVLGMLVAFPLYRVVRNNAER